MAFPRYRHNGTSNLVFADGHVKAMPKGCLNWCRNIYFKGMKNSWNGEDMSWMFDSGQPCANFAK